MPKNGTIYLQFEGEGDIVVRELEKYLAYFRLVYLTIELQGREGNDIDLNINEIDAFWDKLPPHMLREVLKPYWHSLHFPFEFLEAEEAMEKKFGPETLQIKTINKNSPLEITL